MLRVDMAAYLAGQLAEWLADAGIAAADVAGSLKEPIDDALLMVGTAYGSLATASVADADAIGMRAVLRYAGLLRVYDAVSTRVSVSLGGPSVSRQEQQAADQLRKAIADAKAAAEPYLVGAGSAWGTGAIALDYLEPVATS